MEDSLRSTQIPLSLSPSVAAFVTLVEASELDLRSGRRQQRFGVIGTPTPPPRSNDHREEAGEKQANKNRVTGET